MCGLNVEMLLILLQLTETIEALKLSDKATLAYRFYSCFCWYVEPARGGAPLKLGSEAVFKEMILFEFRDTRFITQGSTLPRAPATRKKIMVRGAEAATY